MTPSSTVAERVRDGATSTAAMASWIATSRSSSEQRIHHIAYQTAHGAPPLTCADPSVGASRLFERTPGRGGGNRAQAAVAEAPARLRIQHGEGGCPFDPGPKGPPRQQAKLPPPPRRLLIQPRRTMVPSLSRSRCLHEVGGRDTRSIRASSASRRGAPTIHAVLARLPRGRSVRPCSAPGPSRPSLHRLALGSAPSNAPSGSGRLSGRRHPMGRVTIPTYDGPRRCC